MAESGLEVLWRTARALAPLGRLPPLFFVTDPDRTPDPAAVAERLPRGAGVIYRAFGAVGALETARRLREIADARGLTLLVGLDAGLAEACGADGVHLPERALAEPSAMRADHPDWILTSAAHGPRGIVAAEVLGMDAVLLSPVFPSRSRSAGQPLGVERFSAMARSAGLPVYALGGVTAETAPALIGSGAAGIAAVEGLLDV